MVALSSRLLHLNNMDMSKGDALQSQLIKALEAYGESHLDDNDYEKKIKKAKLKKKQRKRNNQTENDIETSQPNSERQPIALKRKKRKKNKATSVVKECVSEPQKKVVNPKKKYLDSFKADLELVDFDPKGKTIQEQHLESSTTLNQSAVVGLNRKREPEVIVYHNPAKKLKTEVSSGPKPNSEMDKPDFNLKHARFEVQKLGIRGFQGNEREEATAALLVKLGAKPPKNKYYNYREYQELRRKQIEESKQKREMDRNLGYKVSNPNKNRKRPRDKSDIGVVDGQVGKYKGGVQFVKKDDLQGFKNKRRK